MAEEMTAAVFAEMMGPGYVAGLAQKLRDAADAAEGIIRATLEMDESEDASDPMAVYTATVAAAETDPEVWECAPAISDLYDAARLARYLAFCLGRPERYRPPVPGLEGMDLYSLSERVIALLG